MDNISTHDGAGCGGSSSCSAAEESLRIFPHRASRQPNLEHRQMLKQENRKSLPGSEKTQMKVK